MELIALILVAIAGLVAGSFFNVLIYRLPRHESVLWPGSHCPACGRPIKPWENIPVISYLLLRGRCAGCRSTISPVYPIIEAVTAVLALVLWYTAAPSLSSNIYDNLNFALRCGALLCMVPLTLIDLRHYLIPDFLTIPLFCAGIAASFLPGDLTPLQSFLGALAGGGTLYAIGLMGRIVFRKGEAMGGGDIKLLAAIGAVWGPQTALLTIFFGSCLGTLGAGVAMIAGRMNRDHLIPFGPFLAAGLWVSALAGNHIVRAYLSLFP